MVQNRPCYLCTLPNRIALPSDGRFEAPRTFESVAHTFQDPTCISQFGAFPKHYSLHPSLYVSVYLFGGLPQSPVRCIDLSSRQLGQVFLHSCRHFGEQHVVLVRLNEENWDVNFGCFESASQSAYDINDGRRWGDLLQLLFPIDFPSPVPVNGAMKTVARVLFNVIIHFLFLL